MTNETNSIQPALTPEEWESFPEGPHTIAPRVDWPLIVDMWPRWFTPHAFAAIALHGQPFGFTWDDVDRLRTSAEVVADNDHMDPLVYQLRGIAERIAALLPPR